MAEQSVMASKARELYKNLCETEWSAPVTGILIGFFSVLIMAWWRPWGIVGALRNWGDWCLYGLSSLFHLESGVFQYYTEVPKSIFTDSGSVIGLGFVLGAFISACLGKEFALRVPPYREMVKAVLAGILMGVGSALAGGCNIGGFYNAVGNLAANGFAMMLGLIIGVVLGLKLLYLEMEHISWGNGGAKTLTPPAASLPWIGLLALILLGWAAYAYAGSKTDYTASLCGIILLAAAIGYSMQRGRWCMMQSFREPHMTGDCTMAKSVMLSICVVALGAAVLKYQVPMRADGAAVLDASSYVRGTFGWGGVVGGFIFGLGGMLAGGCGSGTLWRVGEGQVKLMIVVPFFAITNSIFVNWFQDNDFEANGVLGKFVYLPNTFGYGGTLLLIGLIMALWYVIVTWNEESNKLIVPM